jgi:hypothetical protein
MKKYSSVFAGDTIKVSDLSSSFSGKNFTVTLNKELGYIWFYTVPKNTILKILKSKIDVDVKILVNYSEIYNPTGNVSQGTYTSSMNVLLDKLFIKDINGNIFYLNDINNVYLNEGMSLGVYIARNTQSGKANGGTGDYTLTITSISFSEQDLPQVQIFGMIEYDSVSAEIEERLNSLSSRVTLLESKINS